MSILVDSSTRVCIQGITGRIGRVQAQYMRDAGTLIVSGVTPGKGGMEVEGVPVFDCMAAAQAQCPADASVLFVPPAAAEAAASDAMDAGIALAVLVTEGIPVHNTMRLRARARRSGSRLLGPTTPGIITPGQTKLGIMPAQLFRPGPVGVISRSGTLSYEIAGLLSQAGIGQSTVVGLGADPVLGTDIEELLALFAADAATDVVVLIGEVGGNQEERAAAVVAAGYPRPVVAYVAGREVPPGVRMGHAGAIVQGSSGSALDKLAEYSRAGVHTASHPAEVVRLVRELL
jgi:succinyl-CoA synthetase alpha subunit